MTKYREYVSLMLENNKEVFDGFRQIHDSYALDEEKYQEEFNKEGERVLAIIHEWENRLCRQSEKAGYASFTSGLAEKFQAEVKKVFPLIDHIGLITAFKKTPDFQSGDELNADMSSSFRGKPALQSGEDAIVKKEPAFTLKKITL